MFFGEGERQLTEAQERCLRDQIITQDKPGPVLHDFRVLLEFLGPNDQTPDKGNRLKRFARKFE